MEGILLIDKPKGMNAFKLVSILRKRTNVKKIGHAGTLDPLATGLMVLLVGKKFTQKSDSFLNKNKEYQATITLGSSTNTYDQEGTTEQESPHVPTLDEVLEVIHSFQGEQLQIPPMFSAKKMGGKKLYDLARAGITIERPPQKVQIEITFVDYTYPLLKIDVKCSKGTYIRSLAHDMGLKLKSFGHLSDLRRTRSGDFSIDNAHTLERLLDDPLPSSATNVAIGVFDGVHLGHQALLKALSNYGTGHVITFSTHPRSLPLLCSLEQRINLIESFGHTVTAVPFESIKDQTAEQFLDQLIEQGLQCFILGYDNHIGKGRAGTPAFIQEYLEKRGVKVEAVPSILQDGQPLSSGRIRKLLESGDLEGAEKLLGRPWSILGHPISGAGLGKKLGTPTLNFSLEGLVFPPLGVYAATVKTPQGQFNSVINIGVSPTLKNTRLPLLEVHLLQTDQLPTSPYEVIPRVFLRSEQHFSSEKQLVDAIEQDKSKALEILIGKARKETGWIG